MLKLHQIYFRKFILLFILLFNIVGIIVYVWLKDMYINQIENSLLENINIVSIHVKDGANLDKLAKDIKNTINTRLTIIKLDGTVIAESHKDKLTMDNHKYREEILEAKNQEYGKIIRHSHTINKDLIYVAKKFGNLYIRMAKEINPIYERLISLAIKIGIALIIFFIIAFFIAYKISVNIEKETLKILRFLTELTKKKKELFINSNFSKEFYEITKLLTKISRILYKKDKQKAKYTAKLKKLSEQKDDIISAISHEFKNPIAVINGYSQTLLDDKNINENIREKFLTKIHNNGEKLSLLIDKLRLSIQLDEKKLRLNKSTVNVNALVKNTIEDIMQNYKNRNINLEEKDTISIDADKTLLEVAILNLIENALKYSEDDVHVEITKEYISIKDSGIGIAKKELEQITKKFYRVSQNNWNNSLGLGLSIVSNIINLHDFKLEIESSQNIGSNFKIVF
ncbi:sensor histidine kinase [Sulfurospirillum sp. 1307]